MSEKTDAPKWSLLKILSGAAGKSKSKNIIFVPWTFFKAVRGLNLKQK